MTHTHTHTHTHTERERERERERVAHNVTDALPIQNIIRALLNATESG
jgi:hypothetical protein